MKPALPALRIATIAVFLAAAPACAPDDIVGAGGYWTPAGHWAGQVIITQDPDDARWPADAVTITSATVQGDSISLDVTYGGGCRDHSFALLANTAWMESYPVQVRVRLAHEGMGDRCKALLARTVRFDLSPLRSVYASSYGTATGVIRLRLDNAPSSPTYAF